MITAKEPPVTELSRDLSTLVNSDLFSDVTFEVEGRCIFAHRAVLVARSEYFHAMFCGGLRETRDGGDKQVNMSLLSTLCCCGLQTRS